MGLGHLVSGPALPMQTEAFTMTVAAAGGRAVLVILQGWEGKGRKVSLCCLALFGLPSILPRKRP